MLPVNEEADAAIALRHDLSEMQPFSEWIDRRVGELSLNPSAAHAVRLCLEEAVLNIIMHNESQVGPSSPIRVWLGRSDGRLGALVEDDGRPFNPLTVPAPEPAESLASAPLGGLGIPIMRWFSREIEYHRERGLNLLVFRFDD
jgi:serine/threonine-protein kinase RsbW